MAPVTSSAINKSKTVAPKAIARRRPAPPATKPQPPSAPALIPTSQTEYDAIEGASQTEPRQPVIQQSTVSAPTRHVSRPHQPSVTSQSLFSGAVDTSSPLPTPPSTQQSVVHPIPPATQLEPVLQTEVPDALANVVAQPEPATSISAARLEPRVATREDAVQESTGPSLSRTLEGLVDATSEAKTGQQSHESTSSTKITSPAPVAGTKRKRAGPPARQQNSVEAPPPQDASPEPHAQDASVQEVQNDDLPTQDAPIQETIEVQNAGAAPMAQMISPERARNMRLRPAPPPMRPAPAAPKAPKTVRAKCQKKNTAPETAEGESNEAVGETQHGEGSTAAASAKKKARAKKPPKSAARIVEDENGDAIDDPEPQNPRESEPPTKKQRKPREPKKKKDIREAAAEDEEIDDPELHEVDPNAVTMSDLTRDRGLGRQSERETKMAAIDWDEVRAKRLEAAEAIMAGRTPGTDGGRQQSNTAEGDAEGDEGTRQPRPAISGPTLRLVDGEMVIVQESMQIDRQAQAEANAANLVINEDDDLTRRVNQMSWIADRKKDPTERLPFFKVKSDPWSEEETDRFFEALKTFGTDFFIISKLFPPKTRRQIKLKFIREERIDKARVDRAVAGESTIPMSINHFAEATGQDVESFKDPKLLEEELRVEGEEQRKEIAEKKKEIEEAKQARDEQMQIREKEQKERAEQRKTNQRRRQMKRGQAFGTGAF
ncbi:hypothetical protein BDV97DRAFT_223311 [Delphinella strobiligena]|nr:hypothetical protein BDV97DRAFT_223311 [Delphinella strobiligena]